MNEAAFIQSCVGRLLTPQLLDEIYRNALKLAAVNLEKAIGGVSVPSGEDFEEELTEGYVLKLGSLEEWEGRLWPLFLEHFREVESSVDPHARIRPDIEGWKRRQKAGHMVAFLLFHEERPVGYMLIALGNSKINDQLIAMEEIFFIRQEHRKGMLALRFIKHVCKVLKELGVYSFAAGCRTVNDISVVYKRLGFNLTAKIHTRIL